MPTITPITNRETFDAATSTATTSTPTHPTGQPTVILISHSPSPPTKKFLPLYEELTKEERWKHVSFCRMEESAETAPLIKFGVQARPVVLFIRKEWSRTLASPEFHEFVKVLEDSFGKEEGS